MRNFKKVAEKQNKTNNYSPLNKKNNYGKSKQHQKILSRIKRLQASTRLENNKKIV